ncbi:MAG: hypothetical protein NZL89_07415, partial [Leptospiraceae bacterium]|nr:hypothetical protein [Leptospiraceae bacterium]
NHRVLIFALPIESNYAPAQLVIGQTSFSDGTPATSQTGLKYPVAVLWDNNHIWISDQNNHRLVVRKVLD